MSICPSCWREVSNAGYYDPNDRSHMMQTCKPDKAPESELERLLRRSAECIQLERSYKARITNLLKSDD
jgi:hypothetical protein